MLNQIVDCAVANKKNILIIGTPRSGTHALGAELSAISKARNLGEICMVGRSNEPWHEINKLYNTQRLTVAQIVQLIAKMHLARDVATIKHHNVIVNIRRRDKVKQFASWIYFRVRDPTGLHGWHNHSADKTNVEQYSFEAQESDITQFMLEQLIDDYFLPDFNLCYEDIVFTQKKYKKNEFAFPIETMFSNLDYVRQCLAEWQYAPEHFKNAK